MSSKKCLATLCLWITFPIRSPIAALPATLREPQFGAPEIAVEENDLDASAAKLSQHAEVQGSTRRPAKRPGLARGSHLDARQLDRLLGARLNTLAARLASRHPRRVGRFPPVRDALELAEHAELREVGVAHAADLEHVEWADLDALGLPLALCPIDDRRELSWPGTTVRRGRGSHRDGFDDRTNGGVPSGLVRAPVGLSIAAPFSGLVTPLPPPRPAR